MALRLVTAAGSTPISLSEAKTHLRVDHSVDDSLITVLISAAVEQVEKFTRRALMLQEWKAFFDCWHDIRIPLPPLKSVDSVSYLDVDGVQQTLSTSIYEVDAESIPARIILKTGQVWPVLGPGVNRIEVSFTAGADTENDVPASLKAAALLIVGSLYENREDAIIGSGLTAVRLPFGAEALMWPYRDMRIT